MAAAVRTAIVTIRHVSGSALRPYYRVRMQRGRKHKGKRREMGTKRGINTKGRGKVKCLDGEAEKKP